MYYIIDCIINLIFIITPVFITSIRYYSNQLIVILEIFYSLILTGKVVYPYAYIHIYIHSRNLIKRLHKYKVNGMYKLIEVVNFVGNIIITNIYL